MKQLKLTDEDKIRLKKKYKRMMRHSKKYKMIMSIIDRIVRFILGIKKPWRDI